MNTGQFSRRNFLRTAGVIAAGAALGNFPGTLFASGERLAKFPGKRELILLTSRPPQLETPLRDLKAFVTPNDALFVRWHISGIPTSVDLSTWRLKVGGNTEKELDLSMEDLKGFEKVSFTAVIQCSGNSRSLFEPRVAGGEWGNGAVGNVTWTGVRLKDILAKAGMKAGTVDICFNGLDGPPLPTVPDFVKSLPVDVAAGDDVIVAYEMNGSQIPMLNGFPARLVVPGWYATYWVKALSDITVLSRPFEGFWVKKAYRIPDNPCGCVTPGTAPEKTIPINRMTTRSMIIDPEDNTHLKSGRTMEIMGVAFSGGYGIRDVTVSVDGGKTWGEARLAHDDRGKYSWVQWFYRWKPLKPGRYTIMARATDRIGESQPFEMLWNPAGYLYNRIQRTEVTVR